MNVPGFGAIGLLAGVAGAGVASRGEGAVLWSVFLISGPSGVTPSPSSGPLHTLPLLHNWPTGSLRSSNLSSSGAGFSCRTGGGFLFRSCLSFPVAKMFWSLCFSFSRSPVRPRSGLVKARREHHSWSVPSWACLLQAAWATSRGLLQSRPLPPRVLLSLSCQERQE